jgi:hypothetical protein
MFFRIVVASQLEADRALCRRSAIVSGDWRRLVDVRAQPSMALVAGTVRSSPHASAAHRRVKNLRVRVVGSMPTTDRRLLSVHARGRVLGVPPAAVRRSPARCAPRTRAVCAGDRPQHSPRLSCAAVARQAGACNAYNPYNAYNACNAYNAYHTGPLDALLEADCAARDRLAVVARAAAQQHCDGTAEARRLIPIIRTLILRIPVLLFFGLSAR